MNELAKIYETASNPGSFGGVDALYREAKRNKLKVTKKQVSEWLSNKLSYTLHKPVRKKFQRNKTRVFYVDELWQLDLCDTSALKQYNDGATFILTIIDVFSKMGFARSLIDKKGPTVLRAFLNVLDESGRSPTKVQTDMGSEFTNRVFKAELKKRDIHFYVTYSENKAAVVERFNRTLKSRMWRYFTHNNTYKYVDVLQQLIDGYNASRHRGVGMPPKNVNGSNQLKIWTKYYSEGVNRKRFKFAVGDNVRISRDKGAFEKGYVQSWSEEYFVVKKRMRRTPHVYVLEDLNGETLLGVFYAEQLQKVSPTKVFPISKVIRRRGNRALVEWRGWPSSFNSWIPTADLQKI